MTPPSLPSEVIGLAEAVLIGFLIGAQREASQGEGHPGVRDFVLIALIGALAGLLENPWLIVASLLAVTAMLAAFYFQVGHRTGITTEMAAIVTYCLGYLAASPAVRLGETLAVGTAIVVVAFLEAKRALHRLVRETVTEKEFDDTLRFLALIFIILPILPAGSYGPYGFFAPRKVWAFVILVSGVSYVGYFLAKFLGMRRGVGLASLLGGLASTTAATVSFAENSAEAPQDAEFYSQAAILANAVQFPRLLLILAVVNPPLATSASLPLASMTVVGLGLGYLLRPRTSGALSQASLGVSNPFRLLPALKFGAVFAAVLLLTKAAAVSFGGKGVYWTSALAGSVDVDAVALSLADLLKQGSVSGNAAALSLLLALAGNAVVKIGIAAYAGTPAFARRLGVSLVVMLLAGAVAQGLMWKF